MRVLEAVDHVNNEQPEKMLHILRRHFPEFTGLRVCVLGLAFRPGTDDMRESPAIPIVRQLLSAGAEVQAYDPIASETARIVFAGLSLKLCADVAEAVEDVDAILLLTRWDEFDIVPSLISQEAVPPLLIDGRRMIEPSSVASYDGMVSSARQRSSQCSPI